MRHPLGQASSNTTRLLSLPSGYVTLITRPWIAHYSKHFSGSSVDWRTARQYFPRRQMLGGLSTLKRRLATVRGLQKV